MLTATALALLAAVLHAGWNLAVRQSGDRLLALWAQFLVAGALGAMGLAVTGGIPAAAWPWAALSGLVHVPYCWYLARAYGSGDFSTVYPVARGGGALLAGIGGIALLGDDLAPLAVAGMVVVGLGLVGLSSTRGGRAGLADAGVVAATIGVYTLADARGVRVAGTAAYAGASFVASATCLSATMLAAGRWDDLRVGVPGRWRQWLGAGAATAATYTLVQVALRRAPVGYVTALRESSVLLAALAGRRLLGEGGGWRRVAAAGGVVTGLVLLVAGR